MGKSRVDAERLASDEDEYDKTFFLPERARWSNLKELKHDIGPEMNKATKAIEEYNPSLLKSIYPVKKQLISTLKRLIDIWFSTAYNFVCHYE